LHKPAYQYTREIMTAAWLALSASGQLVHAADNNILGHELFTRGDFGSAAEVFTDPSWKGAALYRSGQWWRAAETFVRGNDAASFHNLGNTYVKMGYYALALEAYQQAVKIEPDFEDASFNAQLMRDLLALRDESEEGQGLQQPESLGELEQPDATPDKSGSPEGGEESAEAQGEKNDSNSSGEQSTSERAVQAESGPAAHSDENGEDEKGDQGSSSVTGIESESASAQNASGSSTSQSVAGDARTAGARAELEAEQATEQWLNRIQHNPILFLQRHIELETRRRRLAGQQAPEGGDGW